MDVGIVAFCPIYRNPDPHVRFAKLGELKTAKEADTKALSHTWARRYPEFPSELGPTMFAYAYHEDGRPVSVTLPDLKAISARARGF